MDVSRTWTSDGVSNLPVFFKLSVGQLDFAVLLKAIHTQAVLILAFENHHKIPKNTKITALIHCKHILGHLFI